MPEPTGRGQSPAVAAGLSFLWPGLGQFFLGYRRAAAILALPALLAVLLVAIQLDQGAIMFAVSLWDPSYVAAIAALIIVLGIWRIAAVGHAFLTASRRRRSRSPELAFVAALMVVIVSMHGLFVAGTWAWYQTSVSVQNNGLVDDSSFKAAMAGRSSMPTPLPRDTSSFAPYAAGHTPTPAIWKPTNPNRITFLLVGFDSLSGRDGTANTDTMMLVSIDTSTDKVVMVSVPRDTSNFDLYYGGWVGPTFKLNTLWISAANPGFGSPDAPMKTLENEIGYLVGIPVDYYAAIDLYGLATMINTLGGIDFYNDQYIDDPATGITMGTGIVHLTGAEAMR